jgi:hypothetical protein
VTGFTVVAGALFDGVAAELAAGAGAVAWAGAVAAGAVAGATAVVAGGLGWARPNAARIEKNDVTLSPASTIRLALKWCLRRRPAAGAGRAAGRVRVAAVPRPSWSVLAPPP